MLVTQKCQYALRALLDLARRGSTKPVKIAQIAEDQAIPFRFLEIILNQLKQGGFVESRRGTEGGYLLAMDPHQLAVGEIIRFIDGPIYSENPSEASQEQPTPHSTADILFSSLWQQAQKAVDQVFDAVTIADLLEQEKNMTSHYIPNYTI